MKNVFIIYRPHALLLYTYNVGIKATTTVASEKIRAFIYRVTLIMYNIENVHVYTRCRIYRRVEITILIVYSIALNVIDPGGPYIYIRINRVCPRSGTLCRHVRRRRDRVKQMMRFPHRNRLTFFFSFFLYSIFVIFPHFVSSNNTIYHVYATTF